MTCRPGDAALPWDRDRDYVVGEFAREQGVRVPGRLVSSAKSWLSHSGVDRSAAILPWGAAADVTKVSPVTTAARYLSHMREAWNAQIAAEDVEDTFERQLIILTVPASFDEVARELTVRAAAEAGIPNAILLEEPLAAFYAWLSRHEAGMGSIARTMANWCWSATSAAAPPTLPSWALAPKRDGSNSTGWPSAIICCWAATTWT